MNIDWVGIVLHSVWIDLGMFAEMFSKHPWPFVGLAVLLIIVALIRGTRSRRGRYR